MSGETACCKLCGENRQILESHIIPKFVFRWMKNTGGLPYIRFSGSIDKRSQDGPKIKLLCEACEMLLNQWETEFANTCFYPATKGEYASGTYSHWLSKFCVSVLWRAGIWYELNKAEIGPSAEPVIGLTETLEVWRKFILGEIENPSKNEIHLLPISEFANISNPKLPANWNRYCRRLIEIDFPISPSNNFSAVFVKLGPIALFGFIKNDAQKWYGSKVAIKHGFFVKDMKLPRSILEYFADRSRRSRGKLAEMSPKQKEIIEKTMLKNLDSVANSDMFKEMEKDYLRFGQSAFEQE